MSTETKKKNTKKVSKTKTKKPLTKTKLTSEKPTENILKLKNSEFIPENFTGIIELENRYKIWFVEGIKHRTDGPAIEYANGDKEWLDRGWRHRLDGPAVEWATGYKEWWIDSVKYSEQDFKKEIERRNKKTNQSSEKPTENILKLKLGEHIPKNYTGIIEWYTGTKEWFKDGLHHREDGPSIVNSFGSKFWHKEGSPHREDGPAIEYHDGTKFWFKNGKRHRTDGPAVEWYDETKEWWINDVKYPEQDFKKEIEKRNQKPTEIKSIETVSQNHSIKLETKTITLSVTLPQNVSTEIKIDLKDTDQILTIKFEKK